MTTISHSKQNPEQYPFLSEDSIQPYTEHNTPNNIKPRAVYCEGCGYQIITDLAAPKCGICKRNLYTIIRKHELAPGVNEST